MWSEYIPVDNGLQLFSFSTLYLTCIKKSFPETLPSSSSSSSSSSSPTFLFFSGLTDYTNYSRQTFSCMPKIFRKITFPGKNKMLVINNRIPSVYFDKSQNTCPAFLFFFSLRNQQLDGDLVLLWELCYNCYQTIQMIIHWNLLLVKYGWFVMTKMPLAICQVVNHKFRFMIWREVRRLRLWFSRLNWW